MMACILVPSIEAKVYRNSIQNHFGGLYPEEGIQMMNRYRGIEDGYLIDENASLADAIVVDTTIITASDYRYELRFANLNNISGKTRKLKDPISRRTMSIDAPQWGIVFDYTENGYKAVILSCHNSALYDDLTNVRYMTIKLVECVENKVQTLNEVQMSRDVSLESGFNTLSIDMKDGTATIAIGKDELVTVMDRVDCKSENSNIKVGYFVGAGSRIAIDCSRLTYDDSKMSNISRWTLKELDEHFANSNNPLEGYWRYLDRDMEDQWLRLGGRYTLALVKEQDAYDLIYIEGAQVNKRNWKIGMLKGKLKPTLFVDNFEAEWIDATMEMIDKDVQANLENGVILTFKFPVFKSQVRFQKVIQN